MNTDDLIAQGKITVDQWRIAHGLAKLPDGQGEVIHIPTDGYEDVGFIKNDLVEARINYGTVGLKLETEARIRLGQLCMLRDHQLIDGIIQFGEYIRHLEKIMKNPHPECLDKE
ncbi:MAG: hypothetical protein PHX80_03885 [Candidatus Nanoarchaeia archaeon]|nr:hypothetical protein [Candidatus Nanoarchaeia archaeon]